MTSQHHQPRASRLRPDLVPLAREIADEIAAQQFGSLPRSSDGTPLDPAAPVRNVRIRSLRRWQS